MVVHYHRGRERAEAVGVGRLVQADLTHEEEVDRMFEEAGDLDVCAAVAGVWPREDVPVWELPLSRWEDTLRANLTITFLTARGFLRQVERSGHGSLVLVGSTAGLVGEAGHADYAAAKSAILGGLLLSLKNEIVRIAPLGRVNAIAPGWTASPMTRAELEDPELVRRVTRTMPLRKVATSRGRRPPGRGPGLGRALGSCHRADRHGRRRHGRQGAPRGLNREMPADRPLSRAGEPMSEATPSTRKG